MTTAQFDTAEATTTYPLAGIGARAVALFIDNFLSAAIGGILGGNDQWFLGSVVGFLVGFGYQWLFLTRNNGQTPGKMFMGIKVIKVDGTAISDFDVLMRYIGYFVDSFVFGLGWLWAAFDPERQAWHDKLARTYVVSVERAGVSLDDGVTVKAKRKNEDTF
jgi:uncharacterized RDD family membrane protein YckC